jgi:hypothetical protein
MNIKGLLGKGKDPALQIEAGTKAVPVVKADWKKKAKPAVNDKTETKWQPKPAGKGAKSKKRF